MNVKIIGVVLFLIVLQLIPLFTFQHAKPAQSISQMNNKINTASEQIINQLQPTKSATEASEAELNFDRF